MMMIVFEIFHGNIFCYQIYQRIIRLRRIIINQISKMIQIFDYDNIFFYGIYHNYEIEENVSI